MHYCSDIAEMTYYLVKCIQATSSYLQRVMYAISLSSSKMEAYRGKHISMKRNEFPVIIINADIDLGELISLDFDIGRLSEDTFFTNTT